MPGPRTLEKSVLALSDDRSFVDSVTQYLAIHDFHVVKFEQETVDEQVIARTRPDVILADLGLDRLGSVCIFSSVLRQSERPIPVILVADAWRREHAEQGVDQGAYDFIEKPVEGRTVLRVHTSCARVREPDAAQERSPAGGTRPGQ